MIKYFFIIISLFYSYNSFSKEKNTQKIKYRHADIHRFDKNIDPDAQMMIGSVSFEHQGTVLSCDSAVFYQTKNIIRAFGNVIINQGDTLHMYSNYLDYDGNTKMAIAAGKVKLIDAKMTLTSDTINFDKNKQTAYYPVFGEIKDSVNTLTSEKGTYYTKDEKFIFNDNVIIKNKKYTMKSSHLEYYTTPKTVYFFGPSTITSDNNFIYCETGFYDTKNENSFFKKNAFIKTGSQTLKGDSLYYDRNIGFGSASKNIVITDSTKNLILKGEYAEYFELKDSTFVTDKALAINIIDNDSLFIHGDTLMMTLIPNNNKKRLMRVYHRVKIFKSDMQGKCDSLTYSEVDGFMKMMYSPILWSGKNQLTADSIIVTTNVDTNELDSLKLLNNGFIISKDTINKFNQIKGKNIYSKFKDNKLNIINVIGNSETFYYARNDEKELIGINKAVSSYITIKLENNEISEITFIKDPEAELTPNSKVPENSRKLKGFIWRGNERIHTKNDVFEKDIPTYNDNQKIIDNGIHK